MSVPHSIIIPLVNPNEPASVLVELYVTQGQYVNPGDKLCSLETTKSTVELNADQGGYIIGLRWTTGQTLDAGDVLCYIAETPDEAPPVNQPAPATITTAAPIGVRISQPALQLAKNHNLDLTRLPGDVFITEKMVQELIDTATQTRVILQPVYDPNSIIVYGGGGHGKALIDLIRVLSKYTIVGIVDDGIPAGTEIMGLLVLGGSNLLEQLYDCGVHLAANAVGGIGNIATRIKVFERLASVGFHCPLLLHPTAFIETSAEIADGVQVMPHAYVGSDAKIGYGVIVNTGSIVSHDCILGDYVNLSPGSILAGEVTIGDAALIGMGVTVNLRVKIGNGARVGNGATVKQDVPASGIVHAGSVWPQ